MTNNWCILVCDNRMVLAGIVRPHPVDPLTLVVDRCVTIRYWGTTRGIGELAISGPTEKTKIDPEGDGVLLNRHYLIRQITCTERAGLAWTRSTA